MLYGLAKKMERLLDDSKHIKRLLPWLESDDIINFIRKIPLEKNHMRIQITLKHFLNTRDVCCNDFAQEIEDDARDIVVAMPDTSYMKIKEELLILGNIPNRKEVVLRQFLHRKEELNEILKEINVSSVKKRRPETPDNIFEPNSNNNQTKINIKIRKVDGTLEVVSTISNQENPGPSKVSSDSEEHSEEPSTSSASVTSSINSINQFPSSSSDHILSPVSIPETDDPCPEFTSVLNNLIKSRSQDSSNSDTVMPKKSSRVPSIRITRGRPHTLKADNQKEVVQLSSDTEDENPKPKNPAVPNNSNGNNAAEEPRFNLINFVKELSAASEYKIFQLCKQMGLNLTVRPREDKLNLLLNRLLDDVVEVESAGSSDSSSTQEYDYSSLSMVFPTVPPQNKNGLVNVPGDMQPTKPHKKPFLLRPATFTGNPAQAASHNFRPIKAPEPNIIPTQQPNHLPPPLLRVPAQLPQRSYVPVPTLPTPNKYLVPDDDDQNMTDMVERRFRHQIDHPTPRVRPINVQSNIFLPGLRFGINRDLEPQPAFEPLPSTSGSTQANANIDEDNENPDGEALNLSMDSDSDVNAMQVDDESEAGPSNVPTFEGPSNVDKKRERVLDQNLVFRMIEMFPEACPDYIRDVCEGRVWEELDDVVTVILAADDYPRRPLRPPSPSKEVDPEEQYEILKELLPDADPTYLRIQCEKFAHDEKGLKGFINHAMETKSYPTLKEYQRKQQLSAQQKQYTTEFNIENFIQLFPDPEKTFNDPKRAVKMDTYSVHYLTMYFKNRYDKIAIRYIQQVLNDNHFKVKLCDQALERMIQRNEVMKCRRKLSPLPDNLQNIPLLQELAYLTHKEEIKKYMLEQKKKEEQERIEAKENGLMETCQCCYDDEVMPKDTFSCPSGCKFCRDCLRKSCEVAMGEGKTDFPCLAACPNEFTLQTLQDGLPPKMFSKLAQKKALAEIKAAGIEELETCPFCDFASIPNEADKIFRCLNPDCMQESCRKCKEPNHVPLKCEEVEKDQDVKARTYIENKMTEALLRKCWKCGTSFFKEEGCNKMTCSCGAHMCYICQKPVKDYSHFNGIGGDKHHLCPLYSDTNKVNQQNVMGAAAAAKAEIDPSKLKVDPTVGITDHFNSRAKKLPREPHLEVLHRINRPAFPQNINIQEMLRVPLDAREEIPGVRIERGGAVQREEQERLLLRRAGQHMANMRRIQQFMNNHYHPH